MFPHPEIIFSRRMIRQTALERLRQMREESPHANAAETLLGCLIIFQGPFGKKALRALAPQDMDIPTRNAAFSTLRDYNLMQRVSQRRYSVPASLKPLFPITEDMRAQHWAHVSTLPGRPNHSYNRIINYWSDLSLALIWGLDHDPETALELCKIISDFTHVARLGDHWPVLLPFMHTAALRTETPGLRAFVFWQLGKQAHSDKDLSQADAWYEQALVLYAKLQDTMNQSHLLVDRARLAHQRSLIPEARLYYRQSSEFRSEDNQARNHILWLLFQMEIQEKNLEEAIAVFDTIYAQLWMGDQIKAGYLLGKLFHHHNRPAEARDAFARALDIVIRALRPGLSLNLSNILRAWGEMEYQLGDRQVGCNLCQQALVALYVLKETARFFVKEVNELETLIAEMDCDDA